MKSAIILLLLFGLNQNASACDFDKIKSDIEQCKSDCKFEDPKAILGLPTQQCLGSGVMRDGALYERPEQIAIGLRKCDEVGTRRNIRRRNTKSCLSQYGDTKQQDRNRCKCSRFVKHRHLFSM